MGDWLLLATGFAAGAFVGVRNLPLAAIGLGIVLLIAGVQLDVFIR